MKDFKKLIVWEKGMTLVEKVYFITSKFPSNQQFGLTSQVQRSAVSIVSNIAEGAGRASEKEFAYFLNLALGSSCELETQLLVSNRLLFVSEDEINPALQLNAEIQKMIQSLRNKLISSNNKSGEIAEAISSYHQTEINN